MIGKPSYEELEKKVNKLQKKITELEHEKVINHEQKIREGLIQKALPMAFYIASPFGEYGGTWVSDQIERISGFNPEQFMNDKGLWAARLHPEDKQRALQNFEDLIIKEAIELEYRWQIADGSYRWFRDTATLSRDENGNPKEVIGTWLDITGQKHLQDEITKSNKRFKELAEMLPQIVYETDMQGTLTYVNRQAFEATGYTPDDLEKGYNVLSMVVEEDRPKVEQNIRNIVAGKSTYGNEYRLKRKDGSVFPTIAYSNPIMKNGQAVGIRGIIVDISEMKEAEKALQENKAFLSTTIESLPFDFFALDESGRYIMQNSHCRKRWGNIIGKKPEELGLPEDVLSVFLENNKRAFAGKTITEEVEIQIGDRKEFSHNIISPVTNNDNILAVLGINIDISERKKAELGLLESKQNYKELSKDFRALLDAIPDNITLQDSDLKIIWVNQWAADRLGKRAEEIIGKYCYELFHGQQEPCRDCPTIRSLQSGKMEEELVTDAEGNIWNMRSIPLLDDEGNATRVIELGREITEHKKIENALHESEERYRTLFENATDIIQIVRPDGQLLYVNPSWRRLLGYSEEEARSLKIFDIIHPDCESDCDLTFQRAVSEGTTGNIETVFKSKDGRKVIIEGSANCKYSDGKPSFVHCIFRDMTERRKLEEELIKAHKLESVGILAGGIAHDFNNILTALIGNLSLARIHATPGEKVYKRIEEAEKATFRARDLTQQLLTFSKGGEPIKQAVSIIGVIKETSEFVLRGSNVKCEFDIVEDLWSLEADEGQISQVIHNLVINADQAMPEGGIITIHAENVHISLKESLPVKNGDYVVVTVEDHGSGISNKHLNRVFDPYFSTKHKGHGLGLATAYSIIKNHGGLLVVESELGQGTVFRLYLPASENKKITQAAASEDLHTGKGSILLMDDEEDVRMIAKDMLIHLGYEVKTAADGQEALDIYGEAQNNKTPYDAVIMDLIVPGGLGGKETMQRLRKIDPSVKAIVCSGYANDPVMANFEQHGFSGVVPKPYKIEDISKALQDLLSLN